ncbi:GAF domain-containing protein [Fulvivirgaceae bacterium BMA12]|uniref:GAF domain-containing protein n=1 Tax=Agaribacillus aureus TaxID=3051825 RepID=A0ABT8L757_9BACT|nr:GAF domain-containing protein [Fulvivirgaceae bacterium BMA12]
MSEKKSVFQSKWNSIRFKVISAFTFLVVVMGLVEFLALRQVRKLNRGSLKEDFKNLQVAVNDLTGFTNQFILRDRNNDEFFQTGQSNQLIQYNSAHESFNETIDRTELALTNAGFANHEELDQLREEVIIFDSLFSDFRNKLKTRGNEGFGVIGDFDKALNEITRFDFGENNEVLLNLKLLVKDYRLTGDTEIVNNVKYMTYQFSRILENHISNQEEADQVLSSLANYEESLSSLAKIDSVLGTYSGKGLQESLYSQMNSIDEKANLVETQTKVADAYDALVNGIIINLLIIFLTTVALSVLITFILYNGIIKPIEGLKTTIRKMGQGIIPEHIESYQTKEVGEMADYVTRLAESMKDTAVFANDIGNGNFESSFTPLSDEDVLGNALVTMKDNLEKVSREDEKRKWAAEGFSEFIEILRNNNHALEEMCDKILSKLVKYLGANQGAIFIVNDESEEGRFLEMKGCYAWERKKYLEMKIQPGEGLAGQAWLEEKEIFLKEIPENYVNIRSGLGAANPNSIFIIPLKNNEKIYGVLELASFKVFEPFEMEFIEKLGESIAATVSTVKTNEVTQKLLEEAKQNSTQMQAQEEEMKQNVEELQATHEEMTRKEKEYLATIESLQSEQSAPKDQTLDNDPNEKSKVKKTVLPEQVKSTQ